MFKFYLFGTIIPQHSCYISLQFYDIHKNFPRGNFEYAASNDIYISSASHAQLCGNTVYLPGANKKSDFIFIKRYYEDVKDMLENILKFEIALNEANEYMKKNFRKL